MSSPTIRKSILAVADAPGPAEFLLPVMPLLAGDADVRVVAVGKAATVLEPLRPIVCSDEDAARERYADAKPDFLVVAISSLLQGPFVNNALIERAHADGIPIVCLQDFWGNHRWPSNRRMAAYYTTVCVLDELAAKFWREDGFRGDIHITGNPAFDRFAAVNVSGERNRLRQRLDLQSEDRVILYVGQGTPTHVDPDRITFAFLVAALRALGDSAIRLVVRPHPRARDTGYYRELAADIPAVDTGAVPFTEELLPLADIVVSMFSTNSIHACLLRIPTISIILPNAGKRQLHEIGLDDFPPNQSGASIGIYEEAPQQLAGILKKVLSDADFCGGIRMAQEKHFPLTTSAAEKVAASIRALPPESAR